MESKKKRQAACPECGALSEYSTENPFRPFCSERCCLIDLGLWASEGYRIPETTKHDDLSENELEDEKEE